MFNQAGQTLWRYAPTGLNRLNHPSLALPLPNGDIILNDDLNDRVIVVDPRTNTVVWQYGHTGVRGIAAGYLNIPDGVDLVPPYSFAAAHTAALSALGDPDEAGVRRDRCHRRRAGVAARVQDTFGSTIVAASNRRDGVKSAIAPDVCARDCASYNGAVLEWATRRSSASCTLSPTADPRHYWVFHSHALRQRPGPGEIRRVSDHRRDPGPAS